MEAVTFTFENFTEKFGEDLVIVVSSGFQDYLSGNFCRQTQHLDAQQIFDELEGYEYFEGWDTVNKLEDICTWISSIWEDGDCCVSSVLEKSEFEKKQEEEERQRLQQLAMQFCAQHNVSIDSPEFFEALEGSLGIEEDYRYGLREDGLCATAYPGSMAGYDQWCEMNNDSHSRSATLQDLWDHVTSRYPLTFMAYNEQKLQKENE